MDASAAGDISTTVERTSDRELVVRRMFAAPARLVYEAWTRPELFQRWWTPKSCGITFVSCAIDAHVGGGYHFVFRLPSSDQTMAFFGKYLEVVPPSRLVWTNDEGGDGGAVTTVTFEESAGTTRVMLRDLYASKEALDAAIASQSTSGFDEQFQQLDVLLAAA